MYSDQWRGYCKLEGAGFVHSTVNHSQNFVNPADRVVHTQSIESLWSRFKMFIRRKRLTNREKLHEYIGEFMYREAFPHVFSSIVEQLAIILINLCRLNFKLYINFMTTHE